MKVDPPDLGSVQVAAGRLRGIANRTPVVTSRTLDTVVGGSLHLKCESFQRTGSFKFRGAYNALGTLEEGERRRGVLTYSSGNHAQAISLAGRLLGIAVTVVMPTDAPLPKRLATEGYGATVVTYDPEREVREEVAARLREESGAVLIPPYDHPAVIAGQGTAALELIEETGGLDFLFAPCGGGGLLSGSALAAGGTEGCRVIGVEPETADDATRTFRTGTLHTVRNPRTIADGLRTPSLGTYTWLIIRERVHDMVTVSEAEIASAMSLLWTRLKLVVEPSGAVALAGVLKHGIPAGSRAGVIVSGGNVELSAACAILGHQAR